MADEEEDLGVTRSAAAAATATAESSGSSSSAMVKEVVDTFVHKVFKMFNKKPDDLDAKISLDEARAEGRGGWRALSVNHVFFPDFVRLAFVSPHLRRTSSLLLS